MATAPLKTTDLPDVLEEELFQYREPTPENEEISDQRIAEKLGYDSPLALMDAIADGSIDKTRMTAWQNYVDEKPRRHAANQKVHEYLRRANQYAIALRNHEARLLEMNARFNRLGQALVQKGVITPAEAVAIRDGA